MTSDEWIEREYIEARLRRFGGNKTLAARSLRMNLKTLYNRLDKYTRIGAPVSVPKSVKPCESSKPIEARIARQVFEMTRALVLSPLSTVVPMQAKDKRVMVEAPKPKPSKRRHYEPNKPMARWLEMRL